MGWNLLSVLTACSKQACKVWCGRRENFWFTPRGGASLRGALFGGNVIFSRELRLKSKIHTNENVSELDFTYMYRVSGDFSFSYFFFNLKRMDVLVAIFNFNVPARKTRIQIKTAQAPLKNYKTIKFLSRYHATTATVVCSVKLV